MQPEWYYSTGGVPHGPISIEEVGRRLTEDGFPADAFVWHEGFEKWERPDAIPELRHKHKGIVPRRSMKAPASPIKAPSKRRWRPLIGSLFLAATISAAVAGYRVHGELAGSGFLAGLPPQEAQIQGPQRTGMLPTERAAD